MNLYKGKYVLPVNQFIGDGATNLYKFESQRNKIIKKCAEEQAKIMEIPPNKFWEQSLPEQLRSILESFDNGAAEAAALSFLRSRGFAVDEPKANGEK